MATEKKPSIYQDRGTVGSSDELDKYGVWVKSEPQDMSADGSISEDFDTTAGFDNSADFDVPVDDLEPLDFDASDDLDLPADDLELVDLEELSGTVELDNLPDLELPSMEELAEASVLPGSEDFVESGDSFESSGMDGGDIEIEEETIQEEPDAPESLEIPEDFSIDDSGANSEDDFMMDGTAGPGAEEPAEYGSLPDNQGERFKESPSSNEGVLSTQLLMRIADELSSIRSELTTLKKELSSLRPEPVQESSTPQGFFGSEDDDEKIALTGDEMAVLGTGTDIGEEIETPAAPEEEASQESKGFFEDDGDETIALTGDEMDNIINTADFIEEAGADAGEAIMEEAVEEFPAEEETDVPETSIDETDILEKEIEEADIQETADFSGEEEMVFPGEDTVPLDEAGEESEEGLPPLEQFDTEALEEDLSPLEQFDTEALEEDLSPLEGLDTEALEEDLSPLEQFDTETLEEDLPPLEQFDTEALEEGLPSLEQLEAEALEEDTTSPEQVDTEAFEEELPPLEQFDAESLEETPLEDLSIDLEPGEATADDSGLGETGDEFGIDETAEEIELPPEEEALLSPEAFVFEDDISGGDALEPLVDEDMSIIPEGFTVESTDADELEQSPVELPEISLEETEEIAEEAPEEVFEETIEEIPDITLEEIAEEAPVEIAEETVGEIPDVTLEEIAEEAPEEVVEETIEEIPDVTLEEIAEEAPVEIVEETVEEIPVEIAAGPAETVTEKVSAAAAAEKTVSEAGELSGIPSGLKQELKAVLSYMDDLLESLPDDKIEEFARSEYFDTYKKLFKELGLI